MGRVICTYRFHRMRNQREDVAALAVSMMLPVHVVNVMWATGTLAYKQSIIDSQKSSFPIEMLRMDMTGWC